MPAQSPAPAESQEERRQRRSTWPVRIYRLGEEPPDECVATSAGRPKDLADVAILEAEGDPTRER